MLDLRQHALSLRWHVLVQLKGLLKALQWRLSIPVSLLNRDPPQTLISMFAKLLVLFFTVLLLTFTAAPLLGQTLATPARTNCLRKQEMLQRYLVLPESLKHSDRL